MRFFFVIAILSLVCVLHAQDTIPVKQYYELEGKGGILADSVRRDWLANEYNDLLKKYRVTVNCAHCDAFYIEVVLDIDITGKLKGYRVANSNCCDKRLDEQLQEDFMKHFKTVRFPPGLSGFKWQLRLGEVLKC
ncbi:MAG TPA: hypothetical protein VI112_09535 [Bacteroidia bacterium]|jgi:hypothetical protein